MADTITGLIPDIYEAMDIVSREKAGMVQSVTVDSVDGRVAKGQDIVVDVAPEIAGVDIVAANVAPAAADVVEDTARVNMAYSKAYPFNMSGVVNQTLNTSIGGSNTRAGRIAQAIRAAVNDVEKTLTALHGTFGRAYGTVGTALFATDLSATAQVGKILDDNGAPNVDRSFVIGTTEGANLRTLTQVTDANRAGTDKTLRTGELLDVNGFSLKESAQINTHVAGTGAGYLVNNVAGYAVGDRTIAVDTGTGTILAGDIVTFAGDPNQYVVSTGLTAGTIVLARNGLRQPLADNTAVTVIATATRNMAFAKSAVVLATRLPELPDDGDAAIDRQTIVDPNTGLVFEFAKYGGYRQNRYEIGLTWGVGNIKPEHTALAIA